MADDMSDCFLDLLGLVDVFLEGRDSLLGIFYFFCRFTRLVIFFWSISSRLLR